MRFPDKKYLVPVFIILLLLFRFVTELGEKGAPSERFKVIKIIDGDTVELLGGDRLRLLAIDSPEKGDLFYDSAALVLSDLILNKTLRVEFSSRKRDGYGRLLGYIYVDTVFVNKAMIEAGMAHLYLFEDNLKDSFILNDLTATQKAAIEAGVGIWSRTVSEEPYYLARGGSHRFHRPSCASVVNEPATELIRFSSRKDAFLLGYPPCRNCRP